MNLYDYVAAAAALWMIVVSQYVHVATAWAKLWASIFPLLLGVLLAFLVFSRFMGWPTWI